MEKKRTKLEKKLIGNADAKVWAEEFVKMVKAKPTIATDEGTMICWFANAIMAGYDKARNINLDEDWNDQNVGYKELSKEMSLSGKSISYPEAIEGERPIGACVEQPPQFIPINCLQL